MKILVADKFPKAHVDQMKAWGHDVTLNADLEGPTLPGAIAGFDLMIVRSTKVTKECLDAADKLKLVIRAGSGYDTIETAHAATKGVAVCNCPGTNSIAVAELAMGLILSLDRRIPDGVEASRKGVWNKKEFGKASGIFGRTLGFVGLGTIGRLVAERARAFGMKLVAFDPYVKPEDAARMGVTLVADKLEVAKVADVVTVHVPKTKETTHIVDAAFFAAMKPNALFVHTSRGGVVDDAALLEALDSKPIRAALDVFEVEPAASDKEFPNPLAKHPRVFATHHIGASTEQAEEAVADVVLQIVDQFAKTGAPLHKVN